MLCLVVIEFVESLTQTFKYHHNFISSSVIVIADNEASTEPPTAGS